jgi:hypothetical protein
VGVIGGRLKEHSRRAQSSTNPDDSKFYASYPSVKSPLAESIRIRGKYELLDAYIGVYFAQVTSPGIFLARNGLLEHTEDELSWECCRHVADMSARHGDVG